MVVFPGAYLVQSEKDGLRLIAEEGTSSESVIIEATGQTHEQKLTGPTALAISEKEDEQVVALLSISILSAKPVPMVQTSIN